MAAKQNATDKSQHFLKIVESLEDVIVNKDGDAVFQCKIEACPQPEVYWYKDGVPIITDRRTIVTANNFWFRLEINKVTVKDHGVYSIIFKNCANQLASKAVLYVASQSFHDSVLYTPTYDKICHVKKQIRNVQVEVGDTVDLEATFQDELLDLRWFRNNEMIFRTERIVIVTSIETTHVMIKHALPTDSGVYMVVGLTKYGVVSSVGHVHIYDNKFSIRDYVPEILEDLPDEVETNLGEDIRLICKVNADKHTAITWFKGNIYTMDEHLINEDYGHQYIGLKITKPIASDAAKFSVLLKRTGYAREEKTTCQLTIRPRPTIEVPVVELTKPLDTVLGCPGTTAIFDCTFALHNPLYFYVVWYLGRYRVERSNSQFKVICRGGDFLLYIKKLEPGMAGEVTCELRLVLSNRKTVFVNSTVANLVIVTPFIVERGVHRSDVLKPKLYTALRDRQEVELSNNDVYKDHYCHCYIRWIAAYEAGLVGASTSAGTSGNSPNSILLDIVYCRLEEDGLFYLRAVKDQINLGISRLYTYTRIRVGATRHSHTFRIEWEHPLTDPTTWYSIEMAQEDGTFIEAGITSSARFELLDPRVSRIMRFRVKSMRPIPNVTESICIVPSADDGDKSPKEPQVKPIADFSKEYSESGDVIGTGAFGSVVVVKDAAGNFHAAKKMKTIIQKKKDIALREYEMMRMLQHPKLVELTDAFDGRKCFILVMEFLWGGELFDRIVADEYIKEVDVIPYLRQICEGIQYMHSLKIGHLDIKPENIVCVSPNSVQVKIVDYGLARVLKESFITRALYGTRDYVAPEVINYENLTIACDMWSLGVVTYVLLSGVMPFDCETWLLRSASIIRANYNYDDIAFNEISDSAKDFVDNLLVVAPEGRMTATEALAHKWLVHGPSNESKTGHMRRTRQNLKSYLANYRTRWQRAGNVILAAHRLRNGAGFRASAKDGSPRVT